ncbi:MAG: UDP-N-acetylglucosamine--N-acetylmuramyl-(pentapeptide) pyrophosphoryl-undecaprenol N-acetylglucosamine transferase [Myxococcota bacterium]
MAHTVILAGGGTGGHVYPAIAMGDAMRARGHTVHYYGDAARLEGRVAPARGYLFRGVDAAQFPRSGLLAKLKFARSLLRSVMQARTLLRQDQATMVLGVGGYVMAPTVLAAWTLGIPAAIHEANVAPGLANRLCARVAKLVLLTYPETAARLPGNAEKHVVGCPVNPAVLLGERVAAAERYGFDPARPVLVAVGGSLGAAKLNELTIALANDPARDYQILHVTGPRYEAEVTAAYGAVPEGVVVRGYEDRMADAFAVADLVLCRSGSSTLAELCAVGRASVLLPSPNVTDNHQEENARGLERAGAAAVVVERGMDLSAVVALIRVLMGNAPRRTEMAQAAWKLARLDVADQVAQMLDERFPAPA